MEHPGVIDFLGYQSAPEEVLLVMVENRPWDGSELQMFQLQEKLNAYFSFILDGEMLDTYPHFAGKQARIRLECNEKPPEEAVAFLQVVYDQAALQGIAFEVVIKEASCACGNLPGTCGA